MAENFTFSSIAKELSRGWGLTKESLEKACREVKCDPCLIYIVNLLEKIRHAIAEEDKGTIRPGKKPKDAKKFPGMEIGQLLFSMSGTDEGMGRSIIVGKDEDYVVIVREWNDYGFWPHWATDDYFGTPEEVLRHQAEEEIKWHRPRLELCQRAIRVLDEGGDISEFVAGVDL